MSDPLRVGWNFALVILIGLVFALLEFRWGRLLLALIGQLWKECHASGTTRVRPCVLGRCCDMFLRTPEQQSNPRPERKAARSAAYAQAN